ncbi:hypothetical protein TYRP_001478 [Tyrophagus putrescentiae]|nr:hypothetical protein TYRP_001478 [Tyrophagus putrescentiae]
MIADGFGLCMIPPHSAEERIHWAVSSAPTQPWMYFPSVSESCQLLARIVFQIQSEKSDT